MTPHDLDQLLDAALASYAGEPSPQLAGRVLRRVSRPWRRFAPALGVVAAAAAAAGLALFLPPESPAVEPPPLIRAALLPPPLPPPLLRTPLPRAAVRPAAPLAPSPTLPLTPQERQLLVFAQTQPALLESVLVNAPKQMAEPIHIPPLAIEPLAAPE